MGSFHDSVIEYQNELKKGVLQQAYKGLMEYILGLRSHLNARYPDSLVTGSLYSGYMDMTYFPVVTKALKKRGLKIAVVFLHEACRFEIWLSGMNKQVQSNYWILIKESGWDKYHLAQTIKGSDSILEKIVVDRPNFDNLDDLTDQIEKGILIFITDIDGFLATLPE